MMHGSTPPESARIPSGLMTVVEPGSGVALGFLVGWILGIVVLRRVEDSMSMGAGA